MSRVLRQERERRKISLQEVERLTRIPLRDLQLLEGEGDQRVLANPLSLSASLHIYAAFLNINPGGAMTQFTAELQKLQRAVIAKGTKTFPKGTRFITENEKLPPAEDKAGGSGRPLPLCQHVPRQRLRLLLGMLILLLTLGILTFVGHHRGMPGGQRPTEDARSSPEAAVPQAEPPTAAPRVEAPAVDAPSRPPKPPGSSPHLLRVRAKVKVWLRVTIDGQHTKELFLHPGQAVEWSAETGFTLTLGNAGGVELTLDGQGLPPVGKSGQVVRNLQLPTRREPTATGAAF